MAQFSLRSLLAGVAVLAVALNVIFYLDFVTRTFFLVLVGAYLGARALPAVTRSWLAGAATFFALLPWLGVSGYAFACPGVGLLPTIRWEPSSAVTQSLGLLLHLVYRLAELPLELAASIGAFSTVLHFSGGGVAAVRPFFVFVFWAAMALVFLSARLAPGQPSQPSTRVPDTCAASRHDGGKLCMWSWVLRLIGCATRPPRRTCERRAIFFRERQPSSDEEFLMGLDLRDKDTRRVVVFLRRMFGVMCGVDARLLHASDRPDDIWPLIDWGFLSDCTSGDEWNPFDFERFFINELRGDRTNIAVPDFATKLPPFGTPPFGWKGDCPQSFAAWCFAAAHVILPHLPKGWQRVLPEHPAARGVGP